ncbi:DUF1304 domain-containing protein [Reinekea thalattae]|uniref:DUF1304 domain-containing protein n=1 Tax=Reinekea thalattae TaxID=2593301 RepID=A0A5C8ZBZ2_9GAMM|nr:DUF1304 domain-containing protein [Reinekea thalattae]TXR54691.1 DUF1304 domain-containing protein [Reinekea thalattae]
MSLLASIFVALVAIEHAYILILEMFLWTRARTQRVFGLPMELAEKTTVLAANQGLYNGFLSAGLIWSLVHPDALFGEQLQMFFLGCVIVAAAYGSYSVKRSILIVQGLPALIALTLVCLA